MSVLRSLGLITLAFGAALGFAAPSASAGEDAFAHGACLQAFSAASAERGLRLLAQERYTDPSHRDGYRFYFNAKDRDEPEARYRIDCIASPAGRIQTFTLSEGSWRYRSRGAVLDSQSSEARSPLVGSLQR